MRRTIIVLAGLFVAVATVAVWQLPELRIARPVAIAPPPPPAAPAPPLPHRAASGTVQETPAPGQRVEEVGESEGPSPLERILPHQSVGHEAGLHKVKDPLHLGSSAALVMDANTRQVLYAKNEQAVLPIASVTKLMSAIVITEAQQPMDDVITVAEDDIDRERSSRSRLRVGSTMTRAEALRLALMSSENRAAHALGRNYPGGLEAFVRAMNHKAKQLGMNDSVYVDPTGLSAGNRSSARDLATLALAASRYETLRDFSTTPRYIKAVGTRALLYNNSNRLVKSAKWDIELQKTGYIIEAGHCVVMRTRLAARDVVLVLLDANTNRDRNIDAERIRHWIAGDEPAQQDVKVAGAKVKKVVHTDVKHDKDRKVAGAPKHDEPGKAAKAAKAAKAEKAAHRKAARSAKID